MKKADQNDLRPLAVGMAEAARLTGVCRRTLENYAALNLLPTRKIGVPRVVLMRDLEKFLASDQPSASPTAREACDGH